MSGESAEISQDNIIEFPGKDFRPVSGNSPIPEKHGFLGWLRSLRKEKALGPARTREEVKARLKVVKPATSTQTNVSADENSRDDTA